MRFNIELKNKAGEVTHKEDVTANTLRDAVNDCLGPTTSNWWKQGDPTSITITALTPAHHTDAQSG